jgi:hypothetical protein
LVLVGEEEVGIVVEYPIMIEEVEEVEVGHLYGEFMMLVALAPQGILTTEMGLVQRLFILMQTLKLPRLMAW